MNLRKQLSSYIALNNYVEAIKSGQLPTGYTELEYIESSGTQYINTGVVLGQDYTNTNIKLEYDALINSGAKWQVCGTLGTDGIYIGVNSSDIIYYGTGFSDTSTGVTNPFVKCKYINDAKNGVIKVTNLSTNTDIVNLTHTPVTKTTVLPMILFGFSTSATTISPHKMSGKMYNAKIYNNNELIRHFIPAKRLSDSVVGMYDLISNTFFTNRGTGSFVAGPVYNSSIVLTDAITNGLTDLQLKGSEVKNKPEAFLDSVVAKGGTEQNGTPTPDTPIDITSNNGVLKVSPNLFDKNASYALFGGYINNKSVGENTTLIAYSGGDKTIIIKVAPNTTYTVTRVTNLGSVYDRIRCAAFTALPVNNSTGVILCNYMNTQQANATFTTLSDTQYVAINVRNSGAVGDDWTQFVDAFQLEQGSTATQYRPYGQIYTDGTVETIESHGKNLFNPAAKVNGYDIGTDVGIRTMNGWWVSDYIPVKGGEPYTFTSNGLRSGSAIFLCKTIGTTGIIPGESMTVDRIFPLGAGSNTYTIPSGYNFLVINGKISDTADIQVEKGTTPTEYEPYYSDTVTAEMLLKVGNYQDEQEILSGAVTRNVGVKVLDGTEDWTQGAASPTFKASLPVMDSEPKDLQDMLCSHFKPVKTNVTSAVNDNQCAMFTPGGAAKYNKLVIGKYDMPNLTAWKQWLADQYAAGTPVIVIYPLNASTTETVSPQKLFKNPVTVTEASIDNLEVTTTEAEHTVPTPDYPLDIVCNNGVLKVGPNNGVIVEGTPETITITGKNLFNESHIKSVAINDISVVIPVKQNKTYTWSYNKTEYDFGFDSDFVWGIDLNGSKVENGVTLVYANGTYTTASYVTVTVVSPNVVALQTIFRNNVIQPTKENVLASSMQLEEGIRPTKYEEYYQASFAPEDLLKLSDYQDVQSVLDGVVTRNVGIKVLDGTEDWTASSSYSGSCYTYVLGKTPVGQVICSHFQNTSSLSDYSRGKCYKETGAFNLWYGDNIATAIADLKQFLADQYAAGTPVIVVYPLADTVEETVESRDVFITSGTNTIERNSEYVSSDGITVKYKKLR